MKFTLKRLMLKPWVASGLLGVSVCLALYAFFYFAFAVSGNGIGSRLVRASLATGHGIVLLWGFVYPYGLFCPKTLQYTGWSVDPSPDSVECNQFGSPGYCHGAHMYPDDACAQASAMISFVIVIILHFLLYFGIGALFSIFYDRFTRRGKR